MSNQDTTLDRSMSENGLNELPATANNPHASPEPSAKDMIAKSRLVCLYRRLCKGKTRADPPGPEGQDYSPPTFITDFDRRDQRGRHLRPEIDLELSYHLVEDPIKLPHDTLEAYNRRAREMSGRLKTAGRFGASCFVRALAEEIVGTELRVRKTFDNIYSELCEDIRCAFDESIDNRQDRMRRTLGSRTSSILQKINEHGETGEVNTTLEEERGRGVKRS